MKLKDTRDGRILEGELVATISAGRTVTDGEMWRFYQLRPGMKNFRSLSAPMAYDRAVLRRGDQEDDHFYIVPRYPFYESLD